MKSIFFIIIIASVTFPSCKKKKTDVCVTNVTSVSGTYKLTSLRYKPTGGTESEIIATLNTCKRDDLTILNSNGTFNYQDAGVICSPAGNYSGDWALNGNTITIETQVGTILSFDCTTLVFYTNDLPNPGDRLTYSYTKQ